jgi:hypothetical protein
VLQPEEGQSYWQPIWANGYSIVKLSPKHAGPDNLAMGIQIIAPGGYVREHSHTPNQEILFCFAGKGTIIVLYVTLSSGQPPPFIRGANTPYNGTARVRANAMFQDSKWSRQAASAYPLSPSSPRAADHDLPSLRPRRAELPVGITLNYTTWA